jgi:hypothetical protein
MKQKLKLLLTIPLLMLLFKACKPDKGCVDNNEYVYQLESDLKILPYKDFSELTFINKTTRDTCIFIGQSYVYDWGKYTTQEECPQTFNLQRRYIVFNCTKNNNNIIIENTFIKPGNRTMNFSSNNENKSLHPSYFSAPFAYDSLNIEGKYYYNVKDFTAIKSTSEFGFLYTLNNGIIRIIYNKSNDTLNLINIKL